ncbi:KAT8 regulatory NSL complex subunit 1-like [Dunckerocampus dactyliophorus]|uniref:KAT8 regulatory NSL complex subunit 1-like n=1 Tax=Dunckerocampus dactyliophorus TaxID=161453 RepID=UPI0024059019|nr:KAT8 regulatory NSL complex subunit 1-like [Dunckerocampus dactyliophorus]XP_054613758.1 KAT8 regulatory NSL complex subunit 1-like [Dunckerocampus dactyliophorus]XP_054613765.1 KAT8 regulatory NSL complex subunit 1-like [Dunckerocampus dactyliophorus]XP_054613774.1 KAT8 regulatory NSL complex subunit 1-like [Dunckerocampus dactyliophorus]XP_054613784.1 KAT8 regulatory NSL complex subunit 1-like [Dunckerocampus dactyliophorus]XP_054613793.1 KAT8 regulatory NSL complex subunit 1-like [Duncke
MAAMAPALTDAPAEAHHIRFKLAAPSSSLSAASAENNGNPNNILIHSSGPAKCKVASEETGPLVDFCGGDQQQQQQSQADSVAQASALGKLQPLVASYLCSDVTSVPSTKESITLQGVLIKQSVLKSHRILPSSLLNGGDFLLRKRHAIELSGGQLKSLMSGSTNGGGQPMAPVNGLAKKLATMSGSGCVMAMNGDKPPASTDSQSQNQTLDSDTLTVNQVGHIPVKGTLKHKHSTGVCQNTEPTELQTAALSRCSHDNRDTSVEVKLEETDAHTTTSTSPSRGLDRERPGCSQQSSPSLDILDTQVAERTRLSRSRQVEIENRLRRLRKRLQVVQAKQVERHIQQQLGGFLDTAVSRLLAGNRKDQATSTATWRTGRHSSSNNRDSLGRFLKSGSMSLELERLYLSGSANLHSAETAFDSDVTESSSGGDSDLEEEELTRVDIEQRHVKIWKRAESRYTLERAAIISHWNWLQAHISDLEYRIRQQTDIYRQIRASKGSVELGGVGPQEVKMEPGNAQDAASERLEHIATAEPWKGQNGQPVNGVLSRMAECVDGKHQQPLDSTCVAARTRPLVSWRRRRLIQPNTVPNLTGKVSKSSCIQCTCRVNPSCVMCGGRPTPREDPQYELPTLERLSRLDLGVHPILSFPDDVCIGLRLQQVMKSSWNSRSLERSKPLKKLSLKHKLSSSKEKHKFANSLMAVRLGHYKSRADKLRTLESSAAACKTERLHAAPLGPYERNYSRKRLREPLLDTSDSSPKLFVDTSGPCPSLASMHASLHSPVTRQLSTSSDNATPLGIGTPLPIKRRRGESSFDINNIVIPMSVAATTRVEKLQYKEILTPSWRAVDVLSQPIAEEEDERDVEDLSDAAFIQLHQPYEDQERARWTWMALAPAKRRGSRSYKSVDGRTTPLLCGTNPSTPQPASPDPSHYPMLHDYGHVPSPMSPASPDTASNPHTPCSRDSHRLLSSEDTRCSTPDFTFEERTVAPWERRNFPLPEDPTPEPEVEGEHHRPRMRSISGCRASAYGRLDSDDGEPPSDDGGPKHKASGHR